MSVTKMVRDKLKNLTVEEFANTIMHGFGLLLSVAGFVLLVVASSAGWTAMTSFIGRLRKGWLFYLFSRFEDLGKLFSKCCACKRLNNVVTDT